MRTVLLLAVTAACGRISFDPAAGGFGDGGTGDGRFDAPGDALADASQVQDGSFAANVVFVTSTQHRPGELGGLGGADAICNARAAAAGFPGTYVAWLSTSSIDAKDRLGTARGWVRPDGLPFADTVADLAAGRTLYTLTIDDKGATHVPSIDRVRSAITATTGAGNRAFETCGDFTQVTTATTLCGMVSGGTQAWTDETEARCRCDELSSLYCFGVDLDAPVTASSSGPRAFVSSAWLPAGGLAGADAHCAADAAAASLTGTFRALLSTSSASAASRFDLTGLVWRRPDGAALATSRSALMAGSLTAAFDRRADGATTLFGVWTGTTTLAAGALTVADTAYSCLDWTSSSVADSAGVGRPTFAGPRFFSGGGGSSCNALDRSLYCLEL